MLSAFPPVASSSHFLIPIPALHALPLDTPEYSSQSNKELHVFPFGRLPLLFCRLLRLTRPRPAAAQEIPTPASVLGHTPGDDFYLADYEDTVKYFHALAAAAPDRMKMITVGKTSRGPRY